MRRKAGRNRLQPPSLPSSSSPLLTFLLLLVDLSSSSLGTKWRPPLFRGGAAAAALVAAPGGRCSRNSRCRGAGFFRRRPAERRRRATMLLPLAAEALKPEENPYKDLKSLESTSGVPYSTVLDALHEVLPPDELESRNAVSRSDGYWRYIQEGKEPPLELTYGEFDFAFFAELLDGVADDDDGLLCGDGGWDGEVFVDIGSGAGRLVFAAAALHPGLRECRGVELLPGLHKKALEGLSKFRERRLELLPAGFAPVSFVCGSFDDPAVYYGDAKCIFVTASCLPTHLLASLRECVLRQCQTGTVVISTDHSLCECEGSEGGGGGRGRGGNGSTARKHLELVRKVEGWSWVTGGGSTAYVHRVVVQQQ